MSIAYYNGIICKKEEITIPLTDRAVWFGDGVYDAMVGRNGKVYMKEEHLDRFFRNLAAIGLAAPMEREEISRLLDRLAERSGLGDGFFLYLQASGSGSTRAHCREDGAKTNLLITVDRWKMPPSAPIRLITYPDLRYRYCHIKTLNLLPSVLAAAEARQSGAEEAVFCKGNAVTECSHSNVSILMNGVLITHPANEEILDGIAKGCLIRTCGEFGIPVEERVFTVEELKNADEVFVTSTSKFLLRACSLNGSPVGMKAEGTAVKLTESLRGDFLGKTRKARNE